MKRRKRKILDTQSEKQAKQVPLLAVCLIVKDEEKMLGDCLQSVADIANEIIVYDTGSTDKTMEIARQHGAKVIEGYWDNSFSRARNDALKEATATWVLSLDADEQFICDAEAVCDMLRKASDTIDGLLVPIENLHGLGNARSVHTAIRMFRRERCTWEHRLHEQVTTISEKTMEISYLSGGRILHYGYVAEIYSGKNKAERNLELAKEALEDKELSRPYTLMNYGRALESAGKSEEAVDALSEAIEITGDSIVKRLAIRNLISILGNMKRYAEALERIELLRKTSNSQVPADIAEGKILIASGKVEEGLAVLSRVPDKARDDDGMEYSSHMLAAIRGKALALMGNYGQAADIVLQTIARDGIFEADLTEVTEWLNKAGRSEKEIAGYLQPRDLVAILGRVLQLPSETADAVLDAIWEKFPDRLEPLAAASTVAVSCTVNRALVWSSRLRNRGLADACPLLSILSDPSADFEKRVLAAAAAFGAFNDSSVVSPVQKLLDELEEDARDLAIRKINAIAPALLTARAPTTNDTDIAQSHLSEPFGRPQPKMPSIKMQRYAEKPIAEGINLVGKFESTTIYGETARSIANWLIKSGSKVATVSYDPSDCGSDGKVAWDHLGEGDHPFGKTLFILPPDDLINFVLDNGPNAFKRRTIKALWLWDWPKPSRIMQEASNMVHEIIVTSEFSKKAIASFATTAIKVLPIPIQGRSESDFKPDEGSANTPTGVTFITSIDFRTGFERQNPIQVVDAYSCTFDPTDGHRLLVETVADEIYPIERSALIKKIGSRSDIFVYKNKGKSIGEILEEKIAGTRCFISAHRSEGVGYAMSKALTKGIPVIASDCGVAAELPLCELIVPVRTVLVDTPSTIHECIEGGEWAEVDHDVLKSSLRAFTDTSNQEMEKFLTNCREQSARWNSALVHCLASVAVPKSAAFRH